MRVEGAATSAHEFSTSRDIAIRRTHRIRAALIVALGLCGVASTAAESEKPEAGISLELAKERALNISRVRYELTMSIPDALSQPVTGTNVLRFELADRTKPLVIDFEAASASDATVTVNDLRVPTRTINGHLVIPAAPLRAGENAVRIDFRAGDAPLNRSADFLYTWFVPAHAHQAIPCFDQPDLKGRWSVTLEHPAQWQSLANGIERDRQRTGDRVRVRFAETEPLPTYVVAFVVGDMKVEIATRAGRTMRMFHRESDAARLARNRDALFDLHAKALEEVEAYTGIPYPFGKFDFVLVPAFQPGAIEHVGAIAYNAELMLLDPSATQRQLLARAHVIAHETSHMWFGNLVTMRWFDDVWTKEVFANFIADKVIEPQFPEVRHDLQFFLTHYGNAYAVDRSAGTNPIHQPLANLNEAGSLYGLIVYEKSPVVIRQLESLLGEEAFRDGVRAYLRRHAFGNATWDELIAELGRRTKLDLRQWSHMWVDEAGRPVIGTEFQVQDGRVERLMLQQRDPQNRDRLWPQQLRVTAAQRLADGGDAARRGP
jgi:aminopeptidase N